MPIRPRVRRVLRYPQTEICVQIFARLDCLRTRLSADRVPPRRNFQLDLIDGQRRFRTIVKCEPPPELLPGETEVSASASFGRLRIADRRPRIRPLQRDSKRQVERSFRLLLLFSDPREQIELCRRAHGSLDFDC